MGPGTMVSSHSAESGLDGEASKWDGLHSACQAGFHPSCGPEGVFSFPEWELCYCSFYVPLLPMEFIRFKWFIYRLLSPVSLVAQLVKNLPSMQETWVQSLGWKDPLEKGKATHSSNAAWRIPWTIQSMGSQRVRHKWSTFTFTLLCIHTSCSLTLKAKSSHRGGWKHITCVKNWGIQKGTKQTKLYLFTMGGF